MSVTTNPSYKPLTDNTAIALAKRLKLFEENAALTSYQLDDGHSNLLFRIIDEKNKRGIIIKQAKSILDASIEGNSLFISGNSVPEFVPKVYYHDSSLAVTVMEDLSHLQTSRKGLIERKSLPSLSKHIGTYLARTLFYTSDFALGSKKKKELLHTFIKSESCKLTDELVFSIPFFNIDSPPLAVDLEKDVQQILNNQELKIEVGNLKRKFLTQADALIHGNLHTGNILANDIETKVIDPSFAFYGPFGYDIGQFMAHLIILAISQNEADRQTLLDHIDCTWQVFTDTFRELWMNGNQEIYSTVDGFIDEIVKEIFEDAIGFAGCELIRQTTNVAHATVLDQITEKTARLKAKRYALSLGQQLITNRRTFSETKHINEYINNYAKKTVVS
ncbi:S-methyl-5-thioribose kinase [Bacillus sp. PS06]|uniref:S-methyl-5-thioribose kinase n=1 Tax=Bacillus sp. PS06 TaxID=2764176 RepID=UPI001782F6D6|nr:S-methyl-5-thioribose kinase [Bacillus sp. PS06]MBD8067433.1 S-methyl-5-thioribose kinase [Bacillus sp. PS06]